MIRTTMSYFFYYIEVADKCIKGNAVIFSLCIHTSMLVHKSHSYDSCMCPILLATNNKVLIVNHRRTHIWGLTTAIFMDLHSDAS